MTSRPDCDVAVIGAGPAGSRTAQSLAARGLHVTLIEKDPTPGVPVHCTGIVGAECFDRYALPQSLVISPIRSFVLLSPSGRRAPVERNQTQAYVLDRVALDRLLVDRALALGVEFVPSFRVDQVHWTGKRVVISGEREGVACSLTARAAVVATGFGTKLPRKAGLGAPGDLLSGCQAVVEVESTPDLELHTGTAFGNGGFGWLVPWKPGLALAGLMTRRETMGYLDAHIARLQQSGRIGSVHELYRCRAIPLGTATHAVADGVIGVGDVVGQVKPTSGGGIYFGMLAADEAAETLAQALESGDVTAPALAPYEQRWRGLLESEISQGYRLRRLVEQLPETMVDQIHRLLTVPGLRRLLIAAAPPFDWHSGPLTSVLARLKRHSEATQPIAR